MGRTEFLIWKTIMTEPTVGRAKPSTANIVRDAILHQQPFRDTGNSTAFVDLDVSQT